MISDNLCQEKIKESFCGLVKFKQRDNLLEVITPFTTINDKFVSVFVVYTRGKYVITDNGWIQGNYYEAEPLEGNDDINDRVRESFSTSYDIRSTVDNNATVFYYKTCLDVDHIASAVLDLASFTVGLVNSLCINYKDEKEAKERDRFKTEANSFLKLHYGNNVKFRQPLDDLNNIKFNAIISKRSDIYLLSYVTGGTPFYFDNDVRKSIVNFEIAMKSKYQGYIKERITIINNESQGYSINPSSSILSLLNEKMTREPILWEEREKLLEIV